MVACSEDKPTQPEYDYLHVPAEYATIQEAVDSAESGDTILIAPGTYTGEGNRNMNIHNNAVILKSESGAQQTVIDCQQQGRAFSISGVEESPVFIGLTITNGSITQEFGDGGGVTCSSGSPEFRNCIFTNCFAAESGGAMNIYDISTLGKSPILLLNCVFIGNRAFVGGAIDMDLVVARIENCQFHDNGTDGLGIGGAIDSWDCRYEVNRCLFSNNRSSTGSDIYSFENRLEIRNCTFFGATGKNAICIAGLSVSIENTVISSTLTQSTIGLDGSSVLQLSCCDLWNNLDGDWIGSIADQLGVNGNFSADPKFIDPENGNFFIHHDSPCAPHANECGVLIGAFGVGDLEDGNGN
jgi:hypothetical protein